MKSILQSIKPQYCGLIAYGIECPVPVPNSNKRYEVRKNMPKLPTPFKSYVYCTKSDGNGCYPDGSYHWLGKVPFEYVCDYIKVIQALPDRNEYDISADDLKQTHLLQEELWEYGKGKPLYAWHISDLKIYDKPKELSEFEIIDKEFLKECPYRIRVYNNPDYTNGALLKGSYVCNNSFEPDFCRGQCVGATKPLTHPPQSWCYVEEL